MRKYDHKTLVRKSMAIGQLDQYKLTINQIAISMKVELRC